MSDVKEDWPERIVYELAERFVSANHVDEIEYLPVVCEFLRERVQGTTTTDRSPELLESVIGGLPFAAEQPSQLVSPFVLLTLDAVFQELKCLGIAPNLMAVENAVRGAAEAFGASPGLVAELASDLSPGLAAWFRGEGVVSSRVGVVTPHDEAPVNDDQVVVVRLCAESRDTKPVEYSRAEAEAWAYGSQYDLVVDELSHVVIRRPEGKEKEQPLGKIGRALRALLWMALTHVGRTFKYEDLDTVLDLSHVVDSKQLSSIVYQYRSRLGELLGSGLTPSENQPSGHGQRRRRSVDPRPSGPDRSLIERMLTEGGVRTYFVPDTGWTFCWIRRSKDATNSMLLQIR